MFSGTTMIYLIQKFNFIISDILNNTCDNCLLHFPPAGWNYKDVSVRSKQGLGRACVVSSLLHHIPLLGVQERDVRVCSFKQALGCRVTIPPTTHHSSGRARTWPRQVQASWSSWLDLQAGHCWSVKMGRILCQKFLTSWLDRSVDGILEKIVYCRS